MGCIKFRRTSKNFWEKTRVNQVSRSREVLFLTGNPNCLIGFPLFLSYLIIMSTCGPGRTVVILTCSSENVRYGSSLSCLVSIAASCLIIAKNDGRTRPRLTTSAKDCASREPPRAPLPTIFVRSEVDIKRQGCIATDNDGFLTD